MEPFKWFETFFSHTTDLYAYIVLAHEMGHAADKTLPDTIFKRFDLEEHYTLALREGNYKCFKRLYKQYYYIMIRREQIAWELAQQYYPSFIPLDKAKECEDYSIKTYQDSYKEYYMCVLLFIKLVLSAKNMHGFFGSHFSFQMNRNTSFFKIDLEQNEITIPVLALYYRRTSLPNGLKISSFLLFETMLEFLKHTDAKSMNAIEELKVQTLMSAKKQESEHYIQSLLETYIQRKTIWYNNAFERMQSFLGDYKEAFALYGEVVQKLNKTEP